MDFMKPCRIRIFEPGMETYTGFMGTIEFLDGVSVHEVGFIDLRRIGASMRVENAESGTQISMLAESTTMRDMPVDDPSIIAANSLVEVNGVVRSAGEFYNREALEEIADKKGLSGLRVIADRWGVKGRSINEIINDILNAQGNNAAEALAAEETKPVAEVAVDATTQAPE